MHQELCNNGLRITPKKQFRKLPLLFNASAFFLSAHPPVCLVYLCLHLPYQFLSHSPHALVITHHPLIERKGACSVNNLANLKDLIGALNTCLQIFCPINDSCVFASDGGIHILVYLFSPL